MRGSLRFGQAPPAPEPPPVFALPLLLIATYLSRYSDHDFDGRCGNDCCIRYDHGIMIAIVIATMFVSMSMNFDDYEYR